MAAVAPTSLKKLPSEPQELDRVLAPYRVMVAPLIHGTSKVLEHVNTDKLDSIEREGGIQAFSALMYQYGGELDARVLVAMWIVGVSLPRVIKALEDKRAKEAKQRQAGLELVKSEIEKAEQKTAQ